MVPVAKFKLHSTEAALPIPTPGTVVRPACFVGDDRLLAEALKAQRPGAMEAFYDRFAGYVQRILARVVHVEMDLAELMQEVFAEAFSSVRSLRDETRLKAWLTSIAVFTARKHIRRDFKRMTVCRIDSEVEQPVLGTDHEARQALYLTYRVLDRLPVDERIAFCLRFMEGMELTETAEACGVSLATVKRRLSKAQKRFVSEAEVHPVLKEWIHRGDRWEVRL